MFNKQITRIQMTVSIYHPNGYKDVDLALLDEAMVVLMNENGDLLSETVGPDHCDPYVVIEYDTMADAMDRWEQDAEKMRAEFQRIYEWCKNRADEYTKVQAEYGEVDQRIVDIENRVVERTDKAEPGRLSRRLGTLQARLDYLAPIEFGDSITSRP